MLLGLGRIGCTLACCGLLLITAWAHALEPAKQFNQYVHDRWDSDRGLLGGTVYAISESGDGYLWIGTERGLVRFDGFTFTLMQQPLPDAEPIGAVRGLIEDAEGNLWIRLEGPRLLLYHDGKFEEVFTHFHLRAMIITAMSSTVDGGVLLSGLADQTIQYEHGKFEVLDKVPVFSGTVISLAQSRDQSIWAGTRDDGLYHTASGKTVRLSGELADRKINALLPVNNGGLWIGTDEGILFLDPLDRTRIDLPPSLRKIQIYQMTKDRDANIWAATSHGLVRISSTGVVTTDADYQPGHGINTVYLDHNGDLWMGGTDGIARLSDGMFTTYGKEAGLPSGRNGSIYVDAKGRAWIAPRNGGLYSMQNGKAQAITLAGIDKDVVYSITGAPDGVWLGRQTGGLTKLTVKGKSFTAESFTVKNGLGQNSIFSVYQSRDGKLWAGTVSAGVSCLEGTSIQNYTTSNGLLSNTVSSIIESYDGTMWFATPLGLTSYANRHWTRYTMSDGLPSAQVISIFEDSKHVLWIATDHGLAYRSSSQIQVPKQLPPSLREQILGITEDSLGSLWFLTSDHLIQANRDKLLSGQLMNSEVQSFGATEGLRGIEEVRRDHPIASDSAGKIWISLNHGIAVADPRRTLRNLLPITVRIEAMLAAGTPVDLHGDRRIAAGTSSISFRFAGATLAIPQHIRFRYKLDGSDENWSDIVAVRDVTYRNLGPGSYLFRVVASNYDGLWNGPETDIPFIVERAFWQTWWFRVLCALVVCVIAFMLHKLRTYQLTRTLNSRFQERLAERTRIAQELHDTLLQSFQGLMLRFQTGINYLPTNPDHAKNALETALDKADMALAESRNAIQNIRGKATAEFDLVETMNSIMQAMKAEADFKEENAPRFQLLLEGIPRPVNPVLQDDIYRIAVESLRNSFQHARAKQIETEITYGGRLLRIRFRDDGVGIHPDVLAEGRRTGHWGLVGMQERAERIGAKLDIWSRAGAGTEIELRLPGQIAYETPTTKSRRRASGKKAGIHGN